MMRKYQIFIIDDELNILQMMAEALQREEYEITTFQNPLDGLKAFDKNKPDLIITDICMKECSGIDVLRHVKQAVEEIPVILITAHAEMATAIDALRAGAYDYLQKPFKIDELRQTIKQALQKIKLESFTKKRRKFSIESIIGDSSQMKDLKESIQRVAKTDSTVLVMGESGTGKELVARGLHYLSDRAQNTFVSLNCVALPESLIESELFGYKKGSFTGANKDKLGLFEFADKGTIFLDEIGELPLSVQAKLLRVLQEQEVSPLGSNEAKKIDVRVVAATNRKLEEAVRDKTFREDLYFRLNVIPIEIPPLRERKEDLLLLLSHFVEDKLPLRKSGSKIAFSNEVISYLNNYHWPGNIRELEHFVERMMVISDEDELSLNLVEKNILQSSMPDSQQEPSLDISNGLEKATADFEKNIIQKVLNEVGGNKSQAAKVLDVTRQNLQYKIKKYGLDDL